jgi:type III pantothenate kinase
MKAQRTLAIDIGNTTVFGGVFQGRRLVRRFRLPTHGGTGASAWPRLGPVDRAVLCSVVPYATAATHRAIARHCGVKTQVLSPEAPHGLAIAYRDPARLGSDRLACALGARELCPNANVIVVDCGTATTITAVHRRGAILGGAILPGVGLWPAALAARTAQLPAVAVVRPRHAVGRSPEEALHSGIFHGHAGAIREVVARVRTEAFGRAAVTVIGTGGNAAPFAPAGIFTTVQPDLILTGLNAFVARLFPDA